MNFKGELKNQSLQKHSISSYNVHINKYETINVLLNGKNKLLTVMIKI